MDNAPSHPSTEMLQSEDGNTKCLFLPPNTTSPVQPMDQGVLECTKRHYRKELLRKLLLADTAAEDDPELSVVSFWKQLNMKDAMFMVTKAWMMFQKLASWNKLLVSQNAEELVEEPSVQDILNALEFIPGCGDCDETNVKDWIEMDSNDQSYQIQDDDEIVRTVTEGSPVMLWKRRNVIWSALRRKELVLLMLRCWTC